MHLSYPSEKLNVSKEEGYDIALEPFCLPQQGALKSPFRNCVASGIGWFIISFVAAGMSCALYCLMLLLHSELKG